MSTARLYVERNRCDVNRSGKRELQLTNNFQLWSKVCWPVKVTVYVIKQTLQIILEWTGICPCRIVHIVIVIPIDVKKLRFTLAEACLQSFFLSLHGVARVKQDTNQLNPWKSSVFWVIDWASSTNITDPSTQRLQTPLKSPNKPNLCSQSIKYLRCTGRHIHKAFYNLSFVISSFVYMYQIMQDGNDVSLWIRVGSIWTYSSFRWTFFIKDH